MECPLKKLSKDSKLYKVCMARNLGWSANEEKNLQKRIRYNEMAISFFNYIPAYIYLGSWYSVYGFIKTLTENDDHGYKALAESTFERTQVEIKNQRKINHNLFFEWGRHYYRWGEYDSALQMFQRQIEDIQKYHNWKKYPDNSKNIFAAKISIVNCKCKSNRFNVAEIEEEYNNLKAENAKHPHIYHALGVLYMKQNTKENNEKALGYFSKAIKLNKNMYFSYWHKAKIYLIMGKNEDAKKCFDMVMESVSTSPNEIGQIKIKIWGEENNILNIKDSFSHF